MAREGVVYDEGGNAELHREWVNNDRAAGATRMRPSEILLTRIESMGFCLQPRHDGKPWEIKSLRTGRHQKAAGAWSWSIPGQPIGGWDTVSVLAKSSRLEAWQSLGESDWHVGSWDQNSHGAPTTKVILEPLAKAEGR